MYAYKWAAAGKLVGENDRRARGNSVLAGFACLEQRTLVLGMIVQDRLFVEHRSLIFTFHEVDCDFRAVAQRVA